MRHWDIFCAVVDNYGDIGVCWRLARQLAGEHAARVRLWIDDLTTFARLCPQFELERLDQPIGEIEVRHWPRNFPEVDVADVIVEAFACELPRAYLNRMAAASQPPIWINLEYLSAEDWVEDCHQLASPQSEWGLSKYFFFPGFTSRTGGLLRERTLLTDRKAFNAEQRAVFWRRLGLNSPSKRERRVSMFCYENPALLPLLQHWEYLPKPVVLLATAGKATEQCENFLSRQLLPGESETRGSLTIHALPFLEHVDFDRLLWACDVNFVRGEDSFVRAIWAHRPFIWQPYPQAEEAHQLKLSAFLARYLAGGTAMNGERAKVPVTEAVQNLWHAWNGCEQIGPCWDNFEQHIAAIEEHNSRWLTQLDRVGQLTNNLARFAAEMEQRGLADPLS